MLAQSKRRDCFASLAMTWMVLLEDNCSHCEKREARRSNLRHPARIPRPDSAQLETALMPRHDPRDFVGIIRQRIAAPGHMQVGPDQEIVEAVDPARRLAVEIEHRKRRADRAERLLQTRRIAASGKSQQRIALLDAVVHGK